MAVLPIPLFKVFMPESVDSVLKPTLQSGRLATGKQVAAFESRFSEWLGVPGAAALSDASGALTLALYMAGVRPGDEVISSPLACSASLMPIANLFAKPVWCDINPITGMPDVTHIAGLITEKTRAILLYHWSGDVADVSGIAKLAQQHNIKLIEDASEALGAELSSVKLGGVADFTVYSFYATKHITTGEGAVLLAADMEMVKSARYLRRFGIDPTSFRMADGDLNSDFDIPSAGFNFPMNEIAATIGLEQMSHVDEIVLCHRKNGQYFDAMLQGVSGLHLQARLDASISGFWTYSLCAERRDDLVRKLHSHGIGAQRLHMRHDGYSCFGGKERALSGVERFDAQNLSIPCGWWVGEEERERVIECLRSGW